MQMNEKQINWESIGLSNDFFFGKIMQNPYLCQKLLERILPDLNIDHIEYPELQKAIRPDVDAKSVRLDVYVKDSQNTVYNIEMQTVNTKILPQRSRYYQSMIDLQLIDSGEDYELLNKSYVIFICLHDIFGKGRHQYTFKNLCTEDTSLALEDGTTKIFLNANGTKDDVTPELKAFLDYVAGMKSDDPYVTELEAALKNAINNREWRREYMTLAMRDRENQKIGKEEGRREGQLEERAEILKNMLQQGFSDKTILAVIKISPEELRKYKDSL